MLLKPPHVHRDALRYGRSASRSTNRDNVETCFSEVAGNGGIGMVLLEDPCVAEIDLVAAPLM
jgi:hypothetical protein